MSTKHQQELMMAERKKRREEVISKKMKELDLKGGESFSIGDHKRCVMNSIYTHRVKDKDYFGVRYSVLKKDGSVNKNKARRLCTLDDFIKGRMLG